MKKVHSFLVAAYMLGGLALMATTPFHDVRGQLLRNSGGATVFTAASDESLHGAADDGTALTDEATAAYASAAASRRLMLGVLLFTLGGFVHAYQVLREERPVRVTVKKKKPLTLFWLEMKI